jgi:hypothetical protein
MSCYKTNVLDPKPTIIIYISQAKLNQKKHCQNKQNKHFYPFGNLPKNLTLEIHAKTTSRQ